MCIERYVHIWKILSDSFHGFSQRLYPPPLLFRVDHFLIADLKAHNPLAVLEFGGHLSYFHRGNRPERSQVTGDLLKVVHIVRISLAGEHIPLLESGRWVSSICLPILCDCLGETGRTIIVVVQPLAVRLLHQVGDRVLIPRILPKYGFRCRGEQTKSGQSDYGAVYRLGEEEEIENAY